LTDLVIATLCSASIALVFKLGARRGLSGPWTITANYAVAFIAGILIAGEQAAFQDEPHAGLLEFLGSVPGVLGSGGAFEAGATPLWGMSMGVLAGILYLLGFLCYQKSVRENGMALSGSFGKLGILVPVLASVLVWGEIPGPLPSLGVAVALASIVLSLELRLPGRRGAGAGLMLLFLVGGLAEFCNKIYSKYAFPGMQGVFLASVFGTALLISIPRLRGVSPRGADLLAGLALGIPNVLASQFLIRALGAMPAPVAFSVYGAGSMLLMNATGVFVFGEPLTARQKLAVFSTAASLVLVSM
jgi:drug/metabolite transporter (DMT)-like permease